MREWRSIHKSKRDRRREGVKRGLSTRDGSGGRLCNPAEGFHKKWVVFSGFLGPLAPFVVALGRKCAAPIFRGGIIGWPCLIEEFRLAHANNPSMEGVNEDCIVAKLCF
jgi:hypothetical protein